ncbi:39939_t:CDS:2 [Gigaspora margarita]|uniref:39939_t:CDS:1 n=1 Tax=Gigaspora margarita TaxID=4874 RepID=A0ABN7V4V4_GIGMA|nr:39939_t:CDS:2 [Gigaspora margarita]
MTTSMAFRSFKQRKVFNLLPHGGFNNQRIALENAIFLAWFLNRTLIIPPILLFEGFTPAKYRSYDELYNFLSQHIRPDKNQFKYCFQEDQKNCTMMTYTMYNWEELLDFTFLKHHIKYIHRQDFDYKHLLVSLNIYDSTEVYVTGNEHKYQQRYYYDVTSIIELGKFKERVNLIDLNQRSEQLIHFGSAFSSGRIVRQLLESTEFWNKLMKEMLPNNPTLIYIVDKIINKIGGINSFIGVHARLKGGSFDKNQNDIIQELIKRIKEDFEDGVCLTTKIFLATDLNRNHISLKPFFQTFSCIYVLNDFNDLLEPLEFLKNPSDGMILYEFLIPKGSKLYGSDKSTFSAYARRLNEVNKV